MREFLAKCYKIEKLAEKVYMQFAGNPTYSKDVSETFAKMAAEELEHARTIEVAMHTLEPGLDATHCLSKDQIDEMLSLVEGLLVSAEKNKLSSNEALKLALQVEEHLVKVHVNNSLLPGNPDLAEFFADLSKSDLAHVDQLKANIDA